MNITFRYLSFNMINSPEQPTEFEKVSLFPSICSGILILVEIQPKINGGEGFLKNQHFKILKLKIARKMEFTYKRVL